MDWQIDSRGNGSGIRPDIKHPELRMSGMFLFLRPAQLFRPALRLLRFGPLFQHLLAGSELFPPRQDPLFITPLSEPSPPVGRQHDRDIPDRLSRAVTPDLRPQIPLERQSPGSLFPATKKDGKISRLPQYNKNILPLLPPQPERTPAARPPHRSKVFGGIGGAGEGEPF